MASVEYFEKVKETQNSLHEKEKSRLQLEQEMKTHFKSDRQQAKLKAVKLKSYWKKVCDNQKASQQRNEQVLADLERISRHMSTLTTRSEKLKLLKQQYSDYIDRTYPKWQELIAEYNTKSQTGTGQARTKGNTGARGPSPSTSAPGGSPSPMRHPAERPLAENDGNEREMQKTRAHASHISPDMRFNFSDDQQINSEFERQRQSATDNWFHNKPESQHEHGPMEVEGEHPQFRKDNSEGHKRTSSFHETPESAQLNRSGSMYRNESSPEPHIETQIGKDNLSDIWSDDDHLPASDSRQEETIKGVTKAVVTKMLSDNSSPGKVETPRSVQSVPSKSDDSSMKADLSITGLINSLRFLEDDITGRAYSEESIDRFYRTKEPNTGLRNAIIIEANSGDMDSTDELDGEAVSMVILQQLTLVIRSSEVGCVFPDRLLRSNLSNVRDQVDLKSVLPEEVVPIWNELFNHFTILLKHKVMVPNEIAAIFAPCLITEHCQHLGEAHSLLVTILQSELLKLTGDTESLSMFSHRVETKVQSKSALEVPPLRFNSLSDKAITDEDSSFFDQSIPSSKQHVPLNETSAYRALTGNHASQQAEDTDDDVEKQFASVLTPSQTPRSQSRPLTSFQVPSKNTQELANENLDSVLSTDSSPDPSAAHTKGNGLHGGHKITTLKNNKPVDAREIIAGVKISDFDTDTEMDLQVEEQKQEDDDGEFDL